MSGKLRVPEGIFLDPTKANTGLEHKYILSIEGNKDLAEEDKAYVICDYLEDKDYEKFLTSKTGDNRIGFAELFDKQVKEIHNVLHPIEDRDITLEELKSMAHNSFTYAIKTDVALHLLDASKLTREERGN